MSWIEDAAKGKSSTWPNGEPKQVREAADKAAKKDDGKKTK